MTTHTLKDARRAGACDSGYRRFRSALRAAYPDAPKLDAIRWSIGDVARVDTDDALWCLCLVDEPRVRVAAIMPAVRRASAHTEDARVHGCVAAIERWLPGADAVDLAAARDARAAWAERAAWAARAAAWAARDAARAAGAAAGAAGAAETEQQRADLISAFPPTWDI